MWERIAEIAKKELRQTLREPRMRVVLFVPPIVQTLLFGFAVNLDVHNAKIAWMDLDRTVESRELEHRFAASPYFRIVSRPENDAAVQEHLDRGDVMAVVRVLPGFGRDVLRGNTTAVQVLMDGANSNTASIVGNYAAEVISQHATAVLMAQQQEKLMGRTMMTGGPVRLALPGIEVQPRVWFNENLLSRYYFVPGVVVNIIALVTVILTAMSMVREKEIGTMEQIMVTPIRPLELVLGKILPFGLIGLFELALVTTLALVVFQVPLRGSPLLLVVAAVLFLMTTLGAGLFISTISSTQQQAMMSTFFVFLPILLLSGFAFPIENMPVAVQWLTYLNPLRYSMVVVRGLFLKGVGFDVLWPQMLAMLAFGVAILGASALRFHKRLD
jgi:ABC-2 type transport system permease protein